MQIVDIKKNSEAVKKAAEAIRNGGLVVFPTDTVYGLMVDPTNKKAVEKLLNFKNRWTGKAISVAVLDKKMAMEYVKLSKNDVNIYSTLLPGPFTIINNGKHKVAKGIEAENGTLGIRIPDNKYITDLVKLLKKPVTATSANLAGRKPNYSIEGFLKSLSKKKREMIDLIVDAGKLPRNKPSTVIDLTESEIKVLRRGDLITGKTNSLISKSEKETEKIAEFLLHKSLSATPLLPLTKGRLLMKNVLWWGVFWMGLIGIFLSGSRTIWLLTWGFLGFWGWNAKIELKEKIKGLIVGVLLIILLLGMINYNYPLANFLGGWDENGIMKRGQLNLAAVEMIKESPWLGVGLGNFLVKLPEFQKNNQIFWFQPVHNILLLIISEIGLLGSGVLVWLIGRKMDWKKWDKWTWLILTIIFVSGMVDHYWFTIPQNMWLLVLVLGVI